MPIRSRRDRRKRRSAHITADAVALFKQGIEQPQCQDIRIALAAALGRSKFRACPLDRKPHSLIGGDKEPVDAVLDLRRHLLKKIGEGSSANYRVLSETPMV
jgi:hypothetical protein